MSPKAKAAAPPSPRGAAPRAPKSPSGKAPNSHRDSGSKPAAVPASSKRGASASAAMATRAAVAPPTTASAAASGSGSSFSKSSAPDMVAVLDVEKAYGWAPAWLTDAYPELGSVYQVQLRLEPVQIDPLEVHLAEIAGAFAVAQKQLRRVVNLARHGRGSAATGEGGGGEGGAEATAFHVQEVADGLGKEVAGMVAGFCREQRQLAADEAETQAERAEARLAAQRAELEARHREALEAALEAQRAEMVLEREALLEAAAAKEEGVRETLTALEKAHAEQDALLQKTKEKLAAQTEARIKAEAHVARLQEEDRQAKMKWAAELSATLKGCARAAPRHARRARPSATTRTPLCACSAPCTPLTRRRGWVLL